jgi:hypothetical protein
MLYNTLPLSPGAGNPLPASGFLILLRMRMVLSGWGMAAFRWNDPAGATEHGFTFLERLA